MPSPPYDLLRELREIFAGRFTPDTLPVLAFDLGINYADIVGQAHTLKSQNLAMALWQRDKLRDLATVGPRHNSTVRWAELLARHGIEVPAAAPEPDQLEVILDQGGMQITMSIDPVTASIIITSLPPLFEWFRPGVQGVTGRVGEAFGAILQRKIYKRFEEKAQAQPPVQYEAIAQQVLNESTAADATALAKDMKRAAIQILRDPDYFNYGDLEEMWQNCRRPDTKEAFNNMWARKGHSQAGAAEELVGESIRAKTFPQLLNRVLAAK